MHPGQRSGGVDAPERGIIAVPSWRDGAHRCSTRRVTSHSTGRQRGRRRTNDGDEQQGGGVVGPSVS